MYRARIIKRTAALRDSFDRGKLAGLSIVELAVSFLVFSFRFT